MQDIVKFGLSRLERALLTRNDDGTVTFGTPIAMPGAVSMTVTPEGEEGKPFYADNGIYYQGDDVNGGYSIEFNVALLDDVTRRDIYGEKLDETTGVQFEYTEAKTPEYAYICQVEGDKNPLAMVFYACKASRNEFSANTKGESTDVDTDTFTVKAATIPVVYGDDKLSVTKGFIEGTDDNKDKFKAFFESVVVPGKTDEPDEEEIPEV